jgi:hypothetical protein
MKDSYQFEITKQLLLLLTIGSLSKEAQSHVDKIKYNRIWSIVKKENT